MGEYRRIVDLLDNEGGNIARHTVPCQFASGGVHEQLVRIGSVYLRGTDELGHRCGTCHPSRQGGFMQRQGRPVGLIEINCRIA